MTHSLIIAPNNIECEYRANLPENAAIATMRIINMMPLTRSGN